MAALQFQNGDRSVEVNLDQIIAFPAAVDDQEVGRRIQRDQRVVPDVSGVVHTLAGLSGEDVQVLRRDGLAVFDLRLRHDHQIGPCEKRHEGLRGQGMAFHDPDLERHGSRVAPEDRENGASALGPRVDLRQIIGESFGRAAPLGRAALEAAQGGYDRLDRGVALANRALNAGLQDRLERQNSEIEKLRAEVRELRTQRRSGARQRREDAS